MFAIVEPVADHFLVVNLRGTDNKKTTKMRENSLRVFTYKINKTYLGEKAIIIFI
jgi:hypothetical protein